MERNRKRFHFSWTGEPYGDKVVVQNNAFIQFVFLFIYNSLSNESTQKKNYLQVPTFTLVTHLFQARWRSLSWSFSIFFFFSQPRILFRISQAYIIAGIQAQVPLHLGVILSLTGQKLKMSYKLKDFFYLSATQFSSELVDKNEDQFPEGSVW